jgi:hypothetical protein
MKQANGPGGPDEQGKNCLKRAGRRGLIAAAISPTVAKYAMTGVSGQGNVLFLF